MAWDVCVNFSVWGSFVSYSFDFSTPCPGGLKLVGFNPHCSFASVFPCVSDSLMGACETAEGGRPASTTCCGTGKVQVLTWMVEIYLY